MERVECVTAHVRQSQLREGGLKGSCSCFGSVVVVVVIVVAPSAVMEEYFEGRRRVIFVGGGGVTIIFASSFFCRTMVVIQARVGSYVQKGLSETWCRGMISSLNGSTGSALGVLYLAEQNGA